MKEDTSVSSREMLRADDPTTNFVDVTRGVAHAFAGLELTYNYAITFLARFFRMRGVTCIIVRLEALWDRWSCMAWDN